LVELIVVIAIIAILTALVLPAIQGLQNAGRFGTSVYEIADSVNSARSYAMGEGTYVYLGLTEVNRTLDPSVSPQASGLGRVVVASVASKDGTNQTTTWAGSYANGADLTLVRASQLFDFLYIAPVLPTTATGKMARPSTGVDNIKTGTSLFQNPFPQTPFSLPLGSAPNAGKYNFSSAIPFNPQGAIVLNGTAVQWIEIDFQPYTGPAAPAEPPSATQGNQAALMIDGATGAARVYRP